MNPHREPTLLGESRKNPIRVAQCARLAIVLFAGFLGFLLPAEAKEMTSRGVTIESPAQGAIARPGSWVTVKVRLDPSLKARSVSLLVGTWEELISIVDEAPPFELALPIDRKWSGPLRIVCSVLSKGGKLIGSGELVVNVVPSDRPVSIAATDPVNMVASSGSNDARPQEHINVRGKFADGTVRDIARQDLGTTFHSSDPRVVSVDAEGFLTAGVAGRAVITVKNGELSERVPIHVQSSPGPR